MTNQQQANQDQAPNGQATTIDESQPTPLADAALDGASGGIIAILIGVTAQPKSLPGDGSVRPVAAGVARPAP
jgi:hypothetical protein